MSRRTSSRQSNRSKPQKQWINTSIAAVAYLQDFREITKGERTFMVCDLNLVENTSKGNIYHRCSCYVVGEEAQKRLWELDQDLEEERQILMGVLMRGLKPQIFEYDQGKRKGDLAVSFQSSLMYIDWIRVDGEQIYKVQPEDREEGQRLSIPQYQEKRNDDEDSDDEDRGRNRNRTRGQDRNDDDRGRSSQRARSSDRSSGSSRSSSSSRRRSRD